MIFVILYVWKEKWYYPLSTKIHYCDVSWKIHWNRVVWSSVTVKNEDIGKKKENIEVFTCRRKIWRRSGKNLKFIKARRSN